MLQINHEVIESGSIIFHHLKNWDKLSQHVTTFPRCCDSVPQHVIEQTYVKYGEPSNKFQLACLRAYRRCIGALQCTNMLSIIILLKVTHRFPCRWQKLFNSGKKTAATVTQLCTIAKVLTSFSAQLICMVSSLMTSSGGSR